MVAVVGAAAVLGIEPAIVAAVSPHSALGARDAGLQLWSFGAINPSAYLGVGRWLLSLILLRKVCGAAENKLEDLDDAA
jgi:hypothetical protein